MMINQTLDRLYEMRLSAMADEFPRQMELPSMSELSFEEHFGLLADAQWTSKNDKKLKRLLKQANLADANAILADIDCDPMRKLDRAQIARLSSLDWIREHHDLLITGATGTGKTWIISAFGREACHAGFLVRSFRVGRLLTDLEIGKGDGSYNRIMADLKKPDLLILDDFGMEPLSSSASRDLYEVIYERHGAKSMMISSQLPVKEWYMMFEDKTVADAVMDRLANNSYRIEPKGPSRRPRLINDSKDNGQYENTIIG